MKNEFTQNELDEMRKDLNNYKWGIFYFNSKDPRFFVPKRNIAMGWTLNFANTYSYLIVVLIIVIVLVSLISTSKFSVQTKDETGTQIANPASVNCINKGGKLSIVDKPEGQVGMCTLSDGTVCEEWAYFREECPIK